MRIKVENMDNTILIKKLNNIIINDNSLVQPKNDNIYTTLNKITNHFNYIKKYIYNIKNTLDKSVYGHENAKSQIEKIFGQWVNGENVGYCFGFEGSPGVGKTSLAKKGIADCLIDENGESRPFAFIKMGGDTNGSTLNGHNYTYVGSNWGSIVQILMDTQIMNPIIYIDEVDKISKTENGREIIGILTHLLDFNQNDTFQDKYFNGINLDLSKVLFILSYNDPSSIDCV
jgi:ATP-dependent Lon protease